MKDMILLEIHPGIMLIMGAIVFLVLIWAFWPQKGLIALLAKMKMNNQRVHLEDALKFLFDCEYKGTGSNMNSLAGNLNISVDHATRLVERLMEMGLIRMKKEAIQLTDTGKSYALRVIRVHRVWEKYLADETGVTPADWHNEADKLEHYVSDEATEKLAAQMGNPVYDPHGDPIPTSGGEIPKLKGQPLSQMKEGESGVIIHIEDEPKYIYEQLVVQGLYPGMQVYVTKVEENKITFAANGEEYTFTPLFAAHLTIEELQGMTREKQKHVLLSTLEVGEEAEIVGISPHCRGQQRRRLMDLGIVPGSRIAAHMKSASGDPVGYRVMGTTIGIRKQQAEQIFIHRKKDFSYESNE